MIHGSSLTGSSWILAILHVWQFLHRPSHILSGGNIFLVSLLSLVNGQSGHRGLSGSMTLIFIKDNFYLPCLELGCQAHLCFLPRLPIEFCFWRFQSSRVCREKINWCVNNDGQHSLHVVLFKPKFFKAISSCLSDSLMKKNWVLIKKINGNISYNT